MHAQSPMEAGYRSESFSTYRSLLEMNEDSPLWLRSSVEPVLEDVLPASSRGVHCAHKAAMPCLLPWDAATIAVLLGTSTTRDVAIVNFLARAIALSSIGQHCGVRLCIEDTLSSPTGVPSFRCRFTGNVVLRLARCDPSRGSAAATAEVLSALSRYAWAKEDLYRPLSDVSVAFRILLGALSATTQQCSASPRSTWIAPVQLYLAAIISGSRDLVRELSSTNDLMNPDAHNFTAALLSDNTRLATEMPWASQSTDFLAGLFPLMSSTTVRWFILQWMPMLLEEGSPFHVNNFCWAAFLATCSLPRTTSGDSIKQRMRLLNETLGYDFVVAKDARNRGLGFWAVERGCVPALELLVDEHGFDVLSEDLAEPLISVATRMDHVQMVEYLVLQGVDVSDPEMQPVHPMVLAARADADRVLSFFLNDCAGVPLQELGTSVAAAASRSGSARTRQVVGQAILSGIISLPPSMENVVAQLV